MTSTWLRAARKLKYMDPAAVLFALRQIEHQVSMSGLPYKIRSLRTNGLKKQREMRLAALFCHGMSCRLGISIRFAPEEAQDYDFVAMWIADEEQRIARVQLKEVVPEELNPDSSLEAILQKATKYPPSSQDVILAVHLNRRGRIEPNTVAVPDLNFSQVWLFGGAKPDQSEWMLWGDLKQKDAFGTTFQYPAEA